MATGSVFLNPGPLILSRISKGTSVILPCRTNSFIESGVDLYINHIKKTSRSEFDPRIGFTVDSLLLNDRTETPIRCEYRSSTSEIIIVPGETNNQTEALPEIVNLNAWPYVGEELTMSCKFLTKDTYKYVLTWRCPKCKVDKKKDGGGVTEVFKPSLPSITDCEGAGKEF
ncbi:unnamed protein product [Gongylonema pulchrum]|uniref:Ig-like domain-containing protein n=1 Tax=Gongylonema pulchrum TaxID=637853 RepID=A0A183EPM2_9BILA|nr:unnamed protein product [Gongylonema pulchrum]